MLTVTEISPAFVTSNGELIDEIKISTPTTPNGKTYYLLNLPYCLVSQIQEYLEWFEGEGRLSFPHYKEGS
jgi:hypothetical protein